MSDFMRKELLYVQSEQGLQRKGTGYTVDFLPVFRREIAFVTSHLLSWTHTPFFSEKDSNRNLLRGENSFCLEKTYFQKGGQSILKELFSESLKVYFP